MVVSFVVTLSEGCVSCEFPEGVRVPVNAPTAAEEAIARQFAGLPGSYTVTMEGPKVTFVGPSFHKATQGTEWVQLGPWFLRCSPPRRGRNWRWEVFEAAGPRIAGVGYGVDVVHAKGQAVEALRVKLGTAHRFTVYTFRHKDDIPSRITTCHPSEYLAYYAQKHDGQPMSEKDAAVAAARAWVAAQTEAPDPWAIVVDVDRPEAYMFLVDRSIERWSLYESWKKDAVTDVNTVEEFLRRYYKPDRYTGRGAEYAACVLKSHTEHLQRHGYDLISRHESVTGQVVTFYPPQSR